MDRIFCRWPAIASNRYISYGSISCWENPRKWTTCFRHSWHDWRCLHWKSIEMLSLKYCFAVQSRQRVSTSSTRRSLKMKTLPGDRLRIGAVKLVICACTLNIYGVCCKNHYLLCQACHSKFFGSGGSFRLQRKMLAIAFFTTGPIETDVLKMVSKIINVVCVKNLRLAIQVFSKTILVKKTGESVWQCFAIIGRYDSLLESACTNHEDTFGN